MSPERTDYNSWNVFTMFSFHLKVINVNFIVGRAVTQLKEGVNSFHPMSYTARTHRDLLLLQLSFAKARPCPGPGKSSCCTFPLEWCKPCHRLGSGLCQHCHGSAVHTAEDSSGWKGRAAGRWNQATLLQHMSQHQHEAAAAFCGFQNLKPLSPPINSHPRLHGNKPRLGTCLKGELSLAKFNHIRKR